MGISAINSNNIFASRSTGSLTAIPSESGSVNTYIPVQAISGKMNGGYNLENELAQVRGYNPNKPVYPEKSLSFYA